MMNILCINDANSGNIGVSILVWLLVVRPSLCVALCPTYVGSNAPLLRCAVGDCHLIIFAFFRTTFVSAVYKTCTRRASKNAKYHYLEAVFEAFWSVEIFLGQ